jgi:hypothetical protein
MRNQYPSSGIGSGMLKASRLSMISGIFGSQFGFRVTNAQFRIRPAPDAVWREGQNLAIERFDLFIGRTDR